jgi:hypothetical protein
VKYIERLGQVTTINPSRVENFPLMMESYVDAFVKEERPPEAILTVDPSPIFLQKWTAMSLFFGFRSQPLCIEK